MESLKIKNLNFKFEKKVIFENYSLELPLHKIYALIGPSGIGKSTLAHLVSGHLQPNSGEIFLKNKLISKPTRQIFIVHQEDDLFPWLTVLEQLKFTSSSLEEILPLLEIFKLSESINLYPHELSGGMKKRLALLRAELIGAKVLILDETFSSLNKLLIDEILLEMIPRWKEKGMTIVFITHHLDYIKNYIDQVVSL